MKYLTTTLVCFSMFLCIQNAQAQGTIEEELAQNKGLMMDCTGNLEQVMRKIKEIKRKATYEFSAKQSIIDMEQKSLAEEQEIIENRVEENMRLDVLVYHIQDKEKLAREQSILDLKQQELGQRIIDFKTKMLQIEQHLASNYLESILQQNKSINSTITAYIADLDEELTFE